MTGVFTVVGIWVFACLVVLAVVFVTGKNHDRWSKA